MKGNRDGSEGQTLSTSVPHTSLFHFAFVSELTSYGMEYALGQFRSADPAMSPHRILPTSQPAVTGGRCWKSTALVFGSAIAKTVVCYQHSCTALLYERSSGKN